MKVYLIAGEASGDQLGAALMQGFADLGQRPDYVGIGGPAMQAHGLSSLFDMNELSVMGLVEILPKYRHLMRRIDETARDVVDQKPDVLVTIDSPDFCHRVARRVRAQAPDIRIVHYVAPSVWAWRKGRARKMAGHVDQVLALLPFEPPFMQAAGIACDFVGHPIVTQTQATSQDVARFRQDYGLQDSKILLILPGSRSNEVTRLTPIFAETFSRLASTHTDLKPVIPTTANVAGTVRDLTSNWPVQPIILDPREQPISQATQVKRAAFAAADLALAASGTVSLELAATQTPMVIAYDMNWLSWQILSRMVNLTTVTLVNLVTGQDAVPEYLGPACTPENIAAELENLLSDPAKADQQRQAMAACMLALGAGGEAPGLRAARAVLAGLSQDA